MGGIKRKIPLEKKDSRAVAYSKRIKGLYSKASDLCLLSGGHTAMNSMSKVLQDLKDLRFDAVEKRGDYEDVKKKGVLHGTHQEQTLDLQSSSSTLCINDNLTPNFQGFNKNTDEQILAISDNNNNNNSGLTGTLDVCNQEFGLDQIFNFVKSEDLSMNLEKDDVSMVTTNQNPLSDSETVEDGKLVMHTVGHENNLQLSDFDENQILPISDNNNALLGNYEGLCDQELDLDEFIDFEANCESLLMNLEKMIDISMMTANQNQCYDSEAVEDGGSVNHRDLDEDNLLFTDILNEFASITAL